VPIDESIATRLTVLERGLAEREAVIASQQAEIASQQAEIASQQAEIASLRARLAKLEEQLGKNSSNSSKPPSSDGPSTPNKPAKRQKRRGKGRKQGGQPGHEGHHRALVPVDQVDRVVECRPPECGGCGHELGAEDDPTPLRHQVTEIPPVALEVTEYRLHRVACPRCTALTRADLPVGVPEGAFGPRLSALVATLATKYRLSKRLLKQVFSDLLGLTISVGAISNIEHRVSEALAPAVEQARRYVQRQDAANIDETGFREHNAKAWLWVVVAGAVTLFQVARSRGSKVARELLGESFGGIVGSDRWSGYTWIDSFQRQLCWAHLIRDFQAFVDRRGHSAKLGRALLKQTKRMFKWWWRVRDGTLSRELFAEQMTDVSAEVGRLLREACDCNHSKTAGTARHILKIEDALWTFVYTDGVEPTNNIAERAVRKGVLWRKTSFGTQAERGSRFVERMLTVVETCRCQGRDVLGYVTAAVQAATAGRPPPSLLPARDTVIDLS